MFTPFLRVISSWVAFQFTKLMFSIVICSWLVVAAVLLVTYPRSLYLARIALGHPDGQLQLLKLAVAELKDNQKSDEYYYILSAALVC